MRTSKTLKAFGLIVVIALLLIDLGCKTNDAVDPVVEYAYNVRVTYSRDPSKITFPEGNDRSLRFGIDYKSGNNFAALNGIKVAENQFEVVFPKIRKNYELVYYVRDYKLWNPKLEVECATWTAEVLVIENGEVIEIYYVACIDPKSNKAIGIVY